MADVIHDNPLIRQLFTYEQYPIRVITGVRGTGKTFPVQEEIIKSYLRRGEYFIYLRESKEEVNEVQGMGFWDENLTVEKYPDQYFSAKGNALTVDGITIGTMCALTVIGNVRGATLSRKLGKKNITKAEASEANLDYDALYSFAKSAGKKMTTIFFDEFIPITPKLAPVDRLALFRHAVETFSRMRRDVRIYLCGNLTTPDDPFLNALGFTDYEHREVGFRTSKRPDGTPKAVWLHLEPNEAWKEARKQSLVTAFGEDKEMFETGAFKNVDYPKLEKREPRQALCHLYGNEQSVSLWKLQSGKLYVTKHVMSKYPTYVYETRGMTKEQKFIPQGIRDSIAFALKYKNIFFDSYATFEAFYNIIPNIRR